MSDVVQKIKERLSIIDVVGSYVELHKAGKHFKGKSPFTAEKTPSFFVSPDRGVYFCFSSQKGGDMFTFIEEMEGVDFKGALKLLADRAGVELVPEDPQKRDAREAQYALLEEATNFFFAARDAHNSVTDYILDRGVKRETIFAWRIGYAPDEWRSLRSHLASKKFTDAEMLSAGLIKTAGVGKEPYDVFRDRVMFPICDQGGRVVGFSGRTLKKEDGVPKYVNSPETELFKKSEILFGYDKAKQGIRTYDFSLIVEGQFDVVLSHQAGYTNTVAVSGTALTPSHITLLERLSSRTVLALDADRAGIHAVKRAASLMLPRGMDIKVAEMQGGKDPADMVKTDPKAFKKAIGDARHVVEFLLDILRRGTKDERTYKLTVREELLPLIASIPNRIDQEHFEDVVAEKIGTTKDAIHHELMRIDTKPEPAIAVPATKATPSTPKSKPRVVDLMEYVKSILIVLRDEHTLLGEQVEKIAHAFLTEEERVQFSAISDTDIAHRIVTLEQEFDGVKVKRIIEEVNHVLTEFAHALGRERLTQLRTEIKAAEERGEDEVVERLLGETAASQKLLQEKVILVLDTKA